MALSANLSRLSRRRTGKKEASLWGYIIFSQDGHIISIAVHPEQRRKGIGRQLLQKAIDYPRIKKVWAEVRVNNQGAQAFYLTMGFRVISVIPEYYGDEDALIVVRDPRTP